MSTSPLSDVTIAGYFFSGQDSHRQSATLRFDGASVFIDSAEASLQLTPADIDISPRIGNTPRYLHLPGDRVFESTDNDGVDRLSKQTDRSNSAWIHRLENHLGLILAAIVITLATIVGTFLYGVPWASQAIANALPASVVEQVGDSTLSSIDDLWMEPSELPPERQEALQKQFASLLSPVDGQNLRVLFRSSDAIGANAMALPNGAIIFTDDMVNLAEDDRELVAILAHEIGHVAHRHGMKGVVQSSLTTWLIVMMTGDPSAFTDTTVALPAILMSLAYSRDLEREADAYALKTLQQRGISPLYFASIMKRLVATESEPEDERDASADNGDGWQRMSDMLSSHPNTSERIKRFEQNQGKTP